MYILKKKWFEYVLNVQVKYSGFVLGMNLQICFMNETVSDTESPNSDSETPVTNSKPPKRTLRNINSNVQQDQTAPAVPATRPATLSIGQPLLQPVSQPMSEMDFFTRQARLQTEARMALAQAKEMARMQMEVCFKISLL